MQNSPGKTKENPILIEDWYATMGSYFYNLEVNTQIHGIIKEHHRKDLSEKIDEEKGFPVYTSLVVEIDLENNIVETMNTYYKLGKINSQYEKYLKEKEDGI